MWFQWPIHWVVVNATITCFVLNHAWGTFKTWKRRKSSCTFENVTSQMCSPSQNMKRTQKVSNLSYLLITVFFSHSEIKKKKLQSLFMISQPKKKKQSEGLPTSWRWLGISIDSLYDARRHRLSEILLQRYRQNKVIKLWEKVDNMMIILTYLSGVLEYGLGRHIHK